MEWTTPHVGRLDSIQALWLLDLNSHCFQSHLWLQHLFRIL